VHDDLCVGAGPVGDKAGTDQQVARLGQRVVEPLPLVPVILGPALLAERLHDRGHRGGALGGQVAPDHARAAERQAEPHEAVAEIEVHLGVRLRGAPLLDRGGGDRRQIRKGRTRRSGLQQDLVCVRAHAFGQLSGPAGDRVRP
jgi:hypothetical protein